MRNQRGVVALTITILMTLLLLVVTVSMTALTVGQLRQTTDSEGSMVAFNAAESAVEDQIAAARTALAAGNVPANVSCAKYQVGYADITCLNVSTTVDAPVKSLLREQSTQYNLSGSAKPFTAIRVKWNLNCRPPNGGNPCNYQPLPFGISGSSTFGGQFVSGSTWTAPAVIELTAVDYTAGVGLPIKTAVLTPACNAACNTASPVPGSVDINNIGPLAVSCGGNVASTDYTCVANVTGFISGHSYVIRVRPRYTDSDIRLDFSNGGGAVTGIPDQYATIDATARLGGVERRVVEQVKIRSGAFAGLDYVLYGDTNICKDLQITDNGGGSAVISKPNSCSGGAAPAPAPPGPPPPAPPINNPGAPPPPPASCALPGILC